MLQLTNILNAWETPAFAEIFKKEITAMEVTLLPLQQGLVQTSYTDGANRCVIIISTVNEAHTLRIKTGIFYSGIMAGCSCADDPTPITEITEYCEVQFDIDKLTAETTITLLPA